jgi:hypothetical protein
VDEGEGECHREADGALGSSTEKDGASALACRHGSSRAKRREGKEKMDGDKAWGPLVRKRKTRKGVSGYIRKIYINTYLFTWAQYWWRRIKWHV